MIVPRHWAEARVQERAEGKQVTVRRFGWSMDSADEAQAMAEQRARDAMLRIQRGETLHRREPKVAYNGAEGVPIREEILAEHGEHDVVTRNSYGAHCLNTPDVLIADVDDEPQYSGTLHLAVALVSVLAGLAFGRGVLDSWLSGGILALFALMFSGSMSQLLLHWQTELTGGPRARALLALDGFLAANPGWNLRVYETPAGLRIIAAHATFDPTSEEVQRFFKAVDVDRTYAAMCRRQRCFRARLTAKPWNMGMESRIRPRPGVWPVREERRAERSAWVADYEQRASRYAACRFIRQLGSQQTHPRAASVILLHDQASRADSSLPLC